MRLLHLGDLHLGKFLGDFDLTRDQEFILEQITEIAKREKVDGVLIAGDVYDKKLPSEAATRMLNDFLCKLVDLQIKTYIISGNHDSDERLNYGSTLFENSGIYISSVYDGTLHKYVLEDEHGEVCIYMLPYVKASQVKHFHPEADIEDYEDAVRTVIASADIDTSKRNVMIAHQFVTKDGAEVDLGGSEGATVQNVGTVDKIDYTCFDDFDYVALGHIHSAQPIGRETVRYSGSLLKYSLREAHHEKSVPLITLGEKGNVEVKLIALKPMRDLRHLKGSLEKLLAKENVTDAEDFIYATLTNTEIIDDVMSIMQQTYPNTLKVDYEKMLEGVQEVSDYFEHVEQKSFPELITEFYKMMYGRDISDEEMEIVRQAAKEAGIDETD